MSKDDIVFKLWEIMSGFIDVSPENGRVSHDNLSYLKVFKESQQADLKIGRDEMFEILQKRYGDKITAVHKKVINEVADYWCAWSFLMTHYELA